MVFVLCLHWLLKKPIISDNVFQASHRAFVKPLAVRGKLPRCTPFIALVILVECYLIIDALLKAGLANRSKQPDWEEILLSLLPGHNLRRAVTCKLSSCSKCLV